MDEKSKRHGELKRMQEERQELEKIADENMELKQRIHKQEHKIMGIEHQTQKAEKENQHLAGDNNPNWKIRFHQKIKEENNSLTQKNTELVQENKKLNRELDQFKNAPKLTYELKDRYKVDPVKMPVFLLLIRVLEC